MLRKVEIKDLYPQNILPSGGESLTSPKQNSHTPEIPSFPHPLGGGAERNGVYVETLLARNVPFRQLFLLIRQTHGPFRNSADVVDPPSPHCDAYHTRKRPKVKLIEKSMTYALA